MRVLQNIRLLARISHQNPALDHSVPLLRRSSAGGALHHCLPYVKQWHTMVRNAGWAL